MEDIKVKEEKFIREKMTKEELEEVRERLEKYKKEREKNEFKQTHDNRKFVYKF